MSDKLKKDGKIYRVELGFDHGRWFNGFTPKGAIFRECQDGMFQEYKANGFEPADYFRIGGQTLAELIEEGRLVEMEALPALSTENCDNPEALLKHIKESGHPDEVVKKVEIAIALQKGAKAVAKCISEQEFDEVDSVLLQTQLEIYQLNLSRIKAPSLVEGGIAVGATLLKGEERVIPLDRLTDRLMED